MAIRAKVKAALKSWAQSQIVDQSSVTPEHRWAPKEGRFYLNSEAGQISYKPKGHVEANRFRDYWVNQFAHIANLKGKARTAAIFHFYSEIRKREKVRYRATVRTRLKACLLNPFI